MQHPAGAAGTDTGLLFQQDGAEQAVHAPAAVFLGQGRAEETQLTGLEPGLAIDVLLFFPALAVRRDFLLHEAAHAGAEGLVVGVEQGTGDHRRDGRRDMQG